MFHSRKPANRGDSIQCKIKLTEIFFYCIAAINFVHALSTIGNMKTLIYNDTLIKD